MNHRLAEKVRTIVFAFDAGDSRRRAVLALADEIDSELDRLAAVETVVRGELSEAMALLGECVPYVEDALEFHSSEPAARKLLARIRGGDGGS
jgi:hypothetical protein